MVNSLNRIGLSPNCSVENRKLAVELAQLIISWELQRCRGSAAAAAASAAGAAPGAAGAAPAAAAEAGVKRPAEGDAEGDASKARKLEDGSSEPVVKEEALAATGASDPAAAGEPGSAPPAAAGADAAAFDDALFRYHDHAGLGSGNH